MTIKVFTDGASRGNPGKAGIGIYVIRNEVEEKYKEYLGIVTNNVAEYKALIKAIDIINLKKTDRVIFHSDSLLMVNQVNGIFKVKDKNLKKLNEEVLKKLKNKFKTNWNLVYIPREENKVADKLANEAIDSITFTNKPEIETKEENYVLNFRS